MTMRARLLGCPHALRVAVYMMKANKAQHEIAKQVSRAFLQQPATPGCSFMVNFLSLLKASKFCLKVALLKTEPVACAQRKAVY